MKERIKEIILKYLPETPDEVITCMVNDFQDNWMTLPKIKMGEPVYILSYKEKEKKYLKGSVLGVSYLLEEKGLITYYTIAFDGDGERVEIIPEDEIYTNEDEVRRKLLGRK